MIGTVGQCYWRGFMKRRNHQMKSKRGTKHALNRSTWSNYRNLDHMYLHSYREIEDIDWAIRLEEPA